MSYQPYKPKADILSKKVEKLLYKLAIAEVCEKYFNDKTAAEILVEWKLVSDKFENFVNEFTAKGDGHEYHDGKPGNHKVRVQKDKQHK